MDRFTNVKITRILDNVVYYDQKHKKNFRYEHGGFRVPFETLNLKVGHVYSISQITITEFKDGSHWFEWIQTEDTTPFKNPPKPTPAVLVF